MNINIGLDVNGQWIKSTVQSLVSNSINVYTIKFNFSDDWDQYTKTAVFMTNNGVNIEQPVFNDECLIPWESLTDFGYIKIGVYGISGVGSNVVRYPTVWTNNIAILSGAKNTNPNTPTLSAYEQFVSSIQQDAESAEKSAQEAIAAVSEVRQIIDSIQALTTEEVQEVWDSVKPKEDDEQQEGENNAPQISLFALEDEPENDAEIESIELSENNISLEVEQTKVLTIIASPEGASTDGAIWTSENTQVAIVNNGLVTATGVGSTVVTASVQEKTATCEVEVKEKTPEYIPVKSILLNKTNASVKVGESVKISASILPVNATNQDIEWSSENEEIAAVNLGIVVGLSAGTTTITATADGKSASCELEVFENDIPVVPVSSVLLDQETSEVSIDGSIYIKATVLPENATDKTIYWMSDNNNVSIVNGVVTGVKAGQSAITARAGGKSASCSITILPITIQSIALTPSAMTLQTGATGVIKETIVPSNTTDQTILWTSSNTDIASVSDGIVTAGDVEGDATITAMCGTESSTCLVSVKNILPHKYLDKDGLETLINNIKEGSSYYDEDILKIQQDITDIEEKKQDKIDGKQGQFVGFDEDGNAIAVDVDPAEPGPPGPEGKTGEQGPPGKDGEDATINGLSAVTISAGNNIKIRQSGADLEISAFGDAVPVGAIIIYRGDYNDPPAGWVACDGQNDTPDLRDRFVIVGKYTICYIMKIKE